MIWKIAEAWAIVSFCFFVFFRSKLQNFRQQYQWAIRLIAAIITLVISFYLELHILDVLAE